jgi:hypothetical protein
MRSILLLACLFLGPNLFAYIRPFNIKPTTTLTAERANNTSATDSFNGTTNGNISAGSVSKLPLRSLLYAGSTTKIYANWVPWWGTSNHIDIGYSSPDPNQLHRQVQDMISRGIDGLVVDWYSTGSLEQATAGMRQEIEQHPGFEFALMPDSGAYGGLSDPTAKLISDINYAAQNYFVSPNYMRVNGHPVLFPFGLENYPIDWARVQANVQGSPIFMNRNLVGFTYAASSGGYAWGPDQPTGYWDSFYPNAIPLKLPTYGSVSKGFNDSLAAWGSNRFLDQQCGQRWLSTFAEANKYYSASQPLASMQIVTWNDYEEGTEIESGIDNCVSISAQSAGTTLRWNVTGQENTIDHYSVFVSMDGENLMPFADLPTGTHSLDLAPYALYPVSYKFFVKAVGKASIRNQMSNAVAIVPRSRPSVQTLSLTPGVRVARVKASGAPRTRVTLPKSEMAPVTGSISTTIMLQSIPAFVSVSEDKPEVTPNVATTAASDTTVCESSKAKVAKTNADRIHNPEIELDQTSSDCE